MKDVVSYAKANNNTHVVLNNPKVMRNIKWVPHDSGWIKLNIDGAFNNTVRRAGCGGVIRGPIRNWITGFSKNLGLCSGYTTEL